MTKRALLVPLLLLIAADTAVADKLCIPTAYGVPGKDGPPVWTAFDTSTAPGSIDPDMKDPRWRGSTGHALRTGTMDPPLDFRAIYTTSGGQRYVELSWNVSVAAFGSAHVLYVGFTPPGGATPFVIRFHMPGSSGAGQFWQCDGLDDDCAATCIDSTNPSNCAKKQAWYEIYQYGSDCDRDGSPTPLPECLCSYNYAGFTKAAKLTVNTTAPEWIATSFSNSPTTTQWKPSALYGVDSSNRWNMRLRVPIDPNGAQQFDLTKGIPEGTKIWYEAPLDVTSVGMSPHQQWPRLDGHGACFPNTDPKVMEVPADLTQAFGDFVLVDPSYNPGFTPVSQLPAGCGGVSIESSDIHVLGPNGVPGNTIWGDVNNVRFNNTFVATVHNDSSNQVDASTLQARFRIADWGVQPGGSGWPDFSTGQWNDVVPTTGSNPAVNASLIGPGTSQDLTFQWQLSNADITKYGLGATGQTNSRHQCMLVELSSAATSGGGGNIDFSNRSAYTNMEFGSMSTFEQFAKIAAGSGYAGHDVYLILMGKQTPEQLQMDGRTYVYNNAWQKAVELKGLYGGYAYGGYTYAGEQVTNQDMPELNWNSPLLRGWMELAYLERVRQGKISEDAKKVMPALVDDMRMNLSAPTLSDILPAFEVFAYVDTGETYSDGKATRHVLAPLTSFGYDLWHDGSMSGFSQVIDNAQRIAPNVYRVRTDKDGNAIVRVRSTSDNGTLVPVEHLCGGGGCCPKNCPDKVGLNNTLPGLMIGCVLFARRRKKKS